MYNLYISETNSKKLKAKLCSQLKEKKQKQKHKEDVEKRYHQYQNRVFEFLKSVYN